MLSFVSGMIHDAESAKIEKSEICSVCRWYCFSYVCQLLGAVVRLWLYGWNNSVCDTPTVYHPWLIYFHWAHTHSRAQHSTTPLLHFNGCSRLCTTLYSHLINVRFSSVNPFVFSVFRCSLYVEQRIQCGHLLILKQQSRVQHSTGSRVRPRWYARKPFHRVNLCELCDLVGII